jgi:hypothetical protein
MFLLLLLLLLSLVHCHLYQVKNGLHGLLRQRLFVEVHVLLEGQIIKTFILKADAILLGQQFLSKLGIAFPLMFFCCSLGLFLLAVDSCPFAVSCSVGRGALCWGVCST